MQSEPQVFEEILVMPFTGLLGKGMRGQAHTGGPVWPCWSKPGAERYWQVQNGEHRPADRKPQSRSPERHVQDKPCFWIGPLCPWHFGHQIRDFLSRLPLTLKTCEQSRLVFAVLEDHGPIRIEDAPEFFRGILAWFGVLEERVIIVSKPTLFSELRVLPQGEVAGDGSLPMQPDVQFLDYLSQHGCRSHLRDAQAERYKVTLVSRVRHRPLILGEQVIDELFSRAGYHVFYPERHSLQKQLEVYLNSELLVFTEGSALHGLQLLGRNLNQVLVIARRSGPDQFRSRIEPRAQRYDTINVVGDTIPVLGNINGDLALADFSALLRDLHKFIPELPSEVDAEYLASIQKKHLLDAIGSHKAPPLRRTLATVFALARSRPPGYVAAVILRLQRFLHGVVQGAVRRLGKLVRIGD